MPFGQADVLRHGARKQAPVLRNIAQAQRPLRLRDLIHGPTIDEHLAGTGGIQAQHRSQQGALARAHRARYTDDLARCDRHGDILERQSLISRIGKGHVHELDACRARRHNRQGIGRGVQAEDVRGTERRSWRLLLQRQRRGQHGLQALPGHPGRLDAVEKERQPEPSPDKAHIELQKAHQRAGREATGEH